MNDTSHLSAVARAESAAPQLLLRDDYVDDRPLGGVVGSRSLSGAVRLGADRERGLAIDHGALRIRYLEHPDWGRAEVVYGPVALEPGVALAVSVLDGLTTSQTPVLPEGRRGMLARWLATFPRLRLRRPHLKDNLAVGWFPERVSRRRPGGGEAFLVGPGEAEVGEIRLRSGAVTRRAVWNLQNVPLALVTVLRPGTVLFYGASLPDVRGLPAYPALRPLAVMRRDDDARPRYAGVRQSILGEVKYRVDTRVYQTQVAILPEHRTWHGGAHAADALRGSGTLDADGAGWTELQGTFERTPGGARTTSPGRAVALLPAPGPAGLVRVEFDVVDVDGTAGVGLVWDADTAGGGGWRLEWRDDEVRLVDSADGDRVVARQQRPLSVGTHVLEVVGDGRTVGAYLDDALLFDGWPTVTDRDGAASVGFLVDGRPGALLVRSLEAHPRTVVLPGLLDRAPTWQPRSGPVVVADDFRGADGDLVGRLTPTGGRAWARSLGEGRIVGVPGEAARVDADLHRHNPGRTVYTVPWDRPDHVDVAVDVTPPGTGYGQGHQGRSGLVLWQDTDNHFVVNHFIDDGSVGVSISAFLRVDGHEEMYDHDATWSNVATRVRHGVPHRLQVLSDGDRFLVRVDGETVLYRRFSDYRADAPPLRFTRVGLVANWEWGDDTGTRFGDFRLRGPAEPEG